ncbi:MAG: ATP-dependent Clp protease ATP-binding subunit ClpX [Bifidobacteriaceae bacterium]|nr:ATP-dependent Clp protease ATP-binding subunit ClpX [Bifidobacteriaceae bacterium]
MGRIISYGDDIPGCSFCSKSEHQVKKLVTGPGVAICDECIGLCNEIIEEDIKKKNAKTYKKITTPAEIASYLDRYVVGQERAKRTLAVAVYNHYKRIEAELNAKSSSKSKKSSKKSVDNVEIDKSNILILGPSGTGKTVLARTLARIMDVPFVMADATTLTEAGYAGSDVETILQMLLKAADSDTERARKGIIYLDETDKLARKSGQNTSVARDVSGEGVQQALLKIIEGAEAAVPVAGGGKNPDTDTVKIDTRNILFIFGGAFAGLDEIVRERIGKNSSKFGFGADFTSRDLSEDSLLQHVLPEDLEKFGFLPEFVGRIPIISSTDSLSAADLQKILTEPVNSLVRQYEKLFEMDGIKLTFYTNALETAAQIAAESGTGARALRSIMEKTLEDAMFKLPGTDEVAEVRVTRSAVLNKQEPEYILKSPPVKDKKS